MVEHAKSSEEITSVPKFAGVLSVVFAFLAPLAGLILGIVGIVTNKSGSKNKPAIVGLVLSVVMLVVSIVLTFVVLSAFLRNIDSLSETCVEKGAGRHRIGTFVSVTCDANNRIVDVDL